MKCTLFLFAITLLLFGNTINAQVADSSKAMKKKNPVTSVIGIKLGENFGHLTGGPWNDAYKGSLTVGAFTEITRKKIGIRTELQYKTLELTMDESSTLNMEYLELPVLFEYRLLPALTIQAGPQFTGLIFAKGSDIYNPTPDKTDYKSYFKPMDYAAVLGLEVSLPIHISAGARYIYGLSNNNHESVTQNPYAWYSQSFQVFIAYKFQ